MPDDTPRVTVAELIGPEAARELAENGKPDADLLGCDGNVFMLLGRTTKTLKRAGMPEAAKDVAARVMAAGSYDEALRIMMEYVEA